MDWIGMIFNLLAFFLMANHKILAIKLLLCGSLFWIPWAICTHTWTILIIQCFYVIFNFRTLIIWNKNTK